MTDEEINKICDILEDIDVKYQLHLEKIFKKYMERQGWILKVN